MEWMEVEGGLTFPLIIWTWSNSPVHNSRWSHYLTHYSLHLILLTQTLPSSCAEEIGVSLEGSITHVITTELNRKEIKRIENCVCERGRERQREREDDDHVMTLLPWMWWVGVKNGTRDFFALQTDGLYCLAVILSMYDSAGCRDEGVLSLTVDVFVKLTRLGLFSLS